MDTEGPVSVLDRRTRSSSRDRVIADRITRQRSPGPSFRHQRGRGGLPKAGSNSDEDEEVVYRIPQPYRTSFSAKHSVTWGKVDRSRSLSPTSSLRSDLSYCSVPPMLKTSGDKRRPRGQSKSPKRVTYNTRVTVRHSDTEDSVFTELSSHEYEDDEVPLHSNINPFSRSLISPKYNEFSHPSHNPDAQRASLQYPERRQHVRDITNLSFSSADQSRISRDSGLDYSAELRDLSDQIAKMNWSPKHSRILQAQPRQVQISTEQYSNHKTALSSSTPLAPSPPGILKTSPDYLANNRDRPDVVIKPECETFSQDVNAGHSAYSSKPGQLWIEDLSDGYAKTNGKENGSGHYLPAVDNEVSDSPILDNGQPHPRDDIGSSSPTDTSQGDGSPGRGSPVESGRLTPSKRSVSLSITSFLKRVSPHFRRKRSKDRNKKSSSAESSAQSLANTSDPDTDPDISAHASGNNKTKRSGRFSRNRVRQSFLKLVGSGSKSKKKKKTSPESSHYTIEPQDLEKQTSSEDVDEIANGFINKSNEDVGSNHGISNTIHDTDHIIKFNELNNTMDQDIHHQHKNQDDHRDAGYLTTTTVSSYPGLSLSANESIRSEPVSGRMDFFTESDINAILRPHLDNSTPKPSNGRYDIRGGSSLRTAPPSSLDVMPARTKRLMQTSMMSSISGDESIGDCSLDVNLTASEPSLLSGTSQSGGSRQVIIPHSLVNSTEGPPLDDTDNANLKKATPIREQFFHQGNNVPNESYSKSRSDPSSPTDPTHKPSYLKLSCAISGYGKYCRYSTYKDVNRRSPCSSNSSLRSDMSSPDSNMPAGLPGGESTSDYKDKHKPLGWSKLDNRNGNQAVSPVIAVNGHIPNYPTGDTKKDGEYFLKHMQLEEERIKGLCTRAEVYLRSHDLPDEASGKIRAAIGKANLLVSQKFVQFRDLCHNHMQRSPDERETKWEDLQGFWDIVRIQIDNVDEMFAEIELIKQNGWQEVPEMASKFSSASSSPKSGNISQNSTPGVTPSHTPGSKRKNLKQNRTKNTPDSSPEEGQKTNQAIRARDEARKKLLSEKRAAMKQAAATGAGTEPEVEIFLQELPNK